MKKNIKILLFYLKVSRPGLWFATIWLYLLPTSQNLELFNNASFWFGLFYVCFPLNFLVYGWNDVVDFETDKVNPRKNSFWFGAKGTKTQLKKLWKSILIVQLIFVPIITYFAGFKVLLVFAGFVIINWLYNKKENGLRGKPPLELICQIGYLLILPLSLLLNKTENLPLATYLYLFLFSVQSHLIGEVMDIVPDKIAKRKTTATILGMFKTKLLIIGIVIAEIILLHLYFGELYFSMVLILGLIWLLIDLFILFKSKVYDTEQMKLFAIGSNFLGFATIIYVWWSACLLNN